MSIQELLKEQGYNIRNYAYSRKLDYATLYKVITGVYDGKRRGQAQECVKALFNDGLLPEEHPMYEMLVSQAKETA